MIHVDMEAKADEHSNTCSTTDEVHSRPAPNRAAARADAIFPVVSAGEIAPGVEYNRGPQFADQIERIGPQAFSVLGPNAAIDAALEVFHKMAVDARIDLARDLFAPNLDRGRERPADPAPRLAGAPTACCGLALAQRQGGRDFFPPPRHGANAEPRGP